MKTSFIPKVAEGRVKTNLIIIMIPSLRINEVIKKHENKLEEGRVGDKR